MARRRRTEPEPGPRASEEAVEAVEAGPRPFWSGTISFGLVSVPVNLYSAVRATRIATRMLAPDGTPLRRRYYCPEHDRDVEYEELVRGFEVSEGEHVIVTDDELEAVAPRKTRDIDLRLFVDLDQLDPLLFENAYVLTPSGDTTKPYRLLAEAMERDRKAGIATAVIRNKEHLVAILAEGGILRAETLRFADELRRPEDVGLPEPIDPPRKLVTEFERAVQSRSKPRVDVNELADEREERLRELVERKHERSEDVVESREAEPEEDPESGEVVGGEDLFEVIRRNLEGTRPRRAAPARGRARTHGRAVSRVQVPRAPASRRSAGRTRTSRHARGSRARRRS